jgi:hypothetical protein
MHANKSPSPFFERKRKRTKERKIQIFSNFKRNNNMSNVPGDFGVPRSCKCYAALTSGGPLVPHTIDRRAASADDVVIGVKFAGICHSDIHQVRF